MLRGLFELCAGGNKQQISQNVFGRDFSAQSRSFSYFISHIYDEFSILIHDNVDWWYRNKFIEESANSIGRKLELEEDTINQIAMFIDCNCLETSIPGGGPMEAGANAARWDDNIQRSFYNGWKSIHGLKHQTVDTAHGFTIHMYGPMSLRRSDLSLLADSDINNILEELGVYFVFGDSIYPFDSRLMSYFRGQGINPVQIQFNSKMKHVRISIEWNYMVTAALFRYLACTDKLKLLKSSIVTKVYTVATILRNCHIGYYGCQSSSYFNIDIQENFVEKYLTQTDFN